MSAAIGLLWYPGHEPLLVDLRRDSRTTAHATVVPATSSNDPIDARVRVRHTDDTAAIVHHADGSITAPVTIDGREEKLQARVVDLTGHVAVELSGGVRGVVAPDPEEPGAVGIAGVDDVALVAIVAILTIGAMVIVSTGGGFSGEAPGVKVEAQANDDNGGGAEPGGGS